MDFIPRESDIRSKYHKPWQISPRRVLEVDLSASALIRGMKKTLEELLDLHVNRFDQTIKSFIILSHISFKISIVHL